MEESDVVPEEEDDGEPEEDQGELGERQPGAARHTEENREILAYLLPFSLPDSVSLSLEVYCILSPVIKPNHTGPSKLTFHSSVVCSNIFSNI